MTAPRTWLLSAWVGVLLAASAGAATNVDPAHSHAYSPNTGWIDFGADSRQGVVVGEFVCSGYAWSANTGWIHFGSGAPANGIRYSNAAVGDYGVNHEAGALTGYAWSPNLGWLTFTNQDISGVAFDGPRVDLVTGRLSGWIWSANAGWIALDTFDAWVRIESLPAGPDTDGDGLPDAWERLRADGLRALDAAGDPDRDGWSNLQEYLADTDPLDPSSVLRIVSMPRPGAYPAISLSWTARPTRLYRILTRPALNAGVPWRDSGLGLISPGSDGVLTRQISIFPGPSMFYEVEAVHPLQTN